MQDRPQRATSKGTEIIVEIAEPGRQANQFDPGVIRTGTKRRQRLIPGRIVVAQDVETA